MRPSASEISRELLQAEDARAPVRPLSERFPELGVAEAYEVQLEGIAHKRAAGARIVGRKVGLTSRAMQRMLGVDQPDYGHLLDVMRIAGGGSIPAAELIQPKCEPEIAFLLSRELRGPRVTAAAVRRATSGVAPAIEVIDSRIEAWRIKLVDTIADNASSARFVVGEFVPLDDLDLRLVGVLLEQDGEVVQTGAGGAVLGDPVQAVVWLANMLADVADTLRAGDVVLPGALTAAVDARRGTSVRASFDRFGSVAVRFT